MHIERFHIHGFKSVADVEVDGLSDINVFYGANDAGCSNVFQALALWGWLLTVDRPPAGQLSLLPPECLLSWEELEQHFGQLLFQIGGDNVIRIWVEVTLDQTDWQSNVPEVKAAGRELLAELGRYVSSSQPLRVISHVELRVHPRGVLCQTQNQAYAGGVRFDLPPSSLIVLLSRFHLIRAGRRFQVETRAVEPELGRVSHHNLKQALLAAYLGNDARQKRQLTILKRLLAAPPLSMGEMDVVLDHHTDRIDVGFVRANGWLPLENMGSGCQQVLLVLGQILLNDCPIVAIEEPEMNLSARFQQHLMSVLRHLTRDSSGIVSQLFLGTHSPYFEEEQACFGVALDRRGITRLTRLSGDGRPHHFPEDQASSAAGLRLNAFNQITLSETVIKDMNLRCGDTLVLTKNAAGYWELRNAPDRGN